MQNYFCSEICESICRILHQYVKNANKKALLCVADGEFIDILLKKVSIITETGELVSMLL